nr:hypothetical protein [Pseudomonas sp. UBA6718]
MTVTFQKDPGSTQRPGSTVKLVNALVMNDWVSGVALDTVVTVISADTVDWATNSNAGLLANDQLTYRDLLFGMMLPSGNDAAKAIARLVGAMIISGGGPGSSSDPATRYVQAMHAKAASIGMTTAVVADPFGLDSGNLMSANDLAKSMIAYAAVPYLVTVGGTMTHGMTITGPNARAYDVTHTINPAGEVPIPEFICGKTGTVTYNDTSLNTGGCLAVLWQSPLGVKRVTSILGSPADPARYQDLRKLIDFELARLGEL